MAEREGRCDICIQTECYKWEFLKKVFIAKQKQDLIKHKFYLSKVTNLSIHIYIFCACLSACLSPFISAHSCLFLSVSARSCLSLSQHIHIYLIMHLFLSLNTFIGLSPSLSARSYLCSSIRVLHANGMLPMVVSCLERLLRLKFIPDLKWNSCIWAVVKDAGKYLIPSDSSESSKEIAN